MGGLCPRQKVEVVPLQGVPGAFLQESPAGAPCPCCRTPLHLSNAADTEKLFGWYCDNFHVCGIGEQGFGRWRWHCHHCRRDFCQPCHKNLQEDPGASMRLEESRCSAMQDIESASDALVRIRSGIRSTREFTHLAEDPCVPLRDVACLLLPGVNEQTTSAGIAAAVAHLPAMGSTSSSGYPTYPLPTIQSHQAPSPPPPAPKMPIIQQVFEAPDPEAALAIAAIIAQLQGAPGEPVLQAPPLPPPSEPPAPPLQPSPDASLIEATMNASMILPIHQLPVNLGDDLDASCDATLAPLDLNFSCVEGLVATVEHILSPTRCRQELRFGPEREPDTYQLSDRYQPAEVQPARWDPPRWEMPVETTYSGNATLKDVYELVGSLDDSVRRIVMSRDSNLGMVPGPLSFPAEVNPRPVILMQAQNSQSLAEAMAFSERQQLQAAFESELSAERRLSAKVVADAVEDTRCLVEVQLETERKEAAKIIAAADEERVRLSESELSAKEAMERLAQCEKASEAFKESAESSRKQLEAELQSRTAESQKTMQTLQASSEARQAQLESDMKVQLAASQSTAECLRAASEANRSQYEQELQACLTAQQKAGEVWKGEKAAALLESELKARLAESQIAAETYKTSAEQNISKLELELKASLRLAESQDSSDVMKEAAENARGIYEGELREERAIAANALLEAAECNRASMEAERARVQAECNSTAISSSEALAFSRAKFASELEIEQASAAALFLQSELDAERDAAAKNSSDGSATLRAHFESELEAERQRAKNALAEALQASHELEAERKRASEALKPRALSQEPKMGSAEAAQLARELADAQAKVATAEDFAAVASGELADARLQASSAEASAAAEAKARVAGADAMAAELAEARARAAGAEAVAASAAAASAMRLSPQGGRQLEDLDRWQTHTETGLALARHLETWHSQLPAERGRLDDFHRAQTRMQDRPDTLDSGCATPLSVDVQGALELNQPQPSTLEVFVTNTAGIAENSILSVRIGNSRRQQSSLSKLHTHPLKFPLVPESARDSLKLRVLHLRAEARLVLHPIQERYRLKFNDQGQNGSHSCNEQPMSLSFRIRGHQPATSSKPRWKDLDVNDPDDSYLSVHAMEQYMTSLLRCMAHEKIDDVAGFMRGQFECLAGGDGESTGMHDVPSGYVELKLTRAEGLPDGSIITLNGPVKAQAPVEQLLQRSWKLPFNSSTLEPFKVSVLQAGGEAKLQMNPQQHRYHVQLPVSSSLVMEIGLHLRRLGTAATKHSASEWMPEKQDNVVMPKAMSAHDYLESHQLVPLTRELLRDLVTAKPQDPYPYLMEKLASKVQVRPVGVDGGRIISASFEQQLGQMKDAINFIAAKNLAEADGRFPSSYLAEAVQAEACGDVCYAQPAADPDEVAQPVVTTNVSGKDRPGLEPGAACKPPYVPI